MNRSRILASVGALALAAALSPVGLAAGSAPTASPVKVSFVVGGHVAGAGTALRYKGQLYVSLAAVKTLTGTAASYDGATSTISSGATAKTGSAGYLEQLRGQPYYVASAALCWQTAKDGKAGAMQSKVGGVCNLRLPGSPTLMSQHYVHELSVLVSADGHKTPDATNSLTMDFDLGGSYSALSGTVGLADGLNHSAMLVRFLGDGKLISTADLLPASLPVPFKVRVAHVRQLSIVVTNASGAAPNWNNLGQNQYAPGAVVLASPRLTP